jgi:hypothetical protein
LLFTGNGKPPALAVLVLPTLEAMLGADVADDGPMTTCGTVVTGTIVVDGTIAVDGPIVVVGPPLWDVPGLVLIVIDGTPTTVEHKSSNARHEDA